LTLSCFSIDTHFSFSLSLSLSHTHTCTHTLLSLVHTHSHTPPLLFMVCLLHLIYIHRLFSHSSSFWLNRSFDFASNWIKKECKRSDLLKNIGRNAHFGKGSQLLCVYCEGDIGQVSLFADCARKIRSKQQSSSS